MTNVSREIKMRKKIIYLLKSDIDQVVFYSKTLTLPPGMFVSLEEIQACIEECKQKRSHLRSTEVCSKARLPATRTIETFKYFQIRLVALHGPLMGYEDLLHHMNR